MGTQLENLVGPWETVLFSASGGDLFNTIPLVAFALFLLFSSGFFLALVLSQPLASPAGISAVMLLLMGCLALFFMIGEIVKEWRRKILVTSHRVLYRHGTWRARTTDVPLSEISDVRLDTLFRRFAFMARIERGARGAVLVSLLPRLDELRDTIANEIGLPPPQRQDRAVRLGLFSMVAGATLCGAVLSQLPTLILFLAGGGGDYWSAGSVLWQCVFLYPVETTAGAIAVGIAAFIGFLMYMWLIVTCFFAGWLFGYFPALAVMRMFLTAEQAQQTICGYYAGTPLSRFGLVVRWQTRRLARFASWLYGTEIRCD